MTSLRHVLAFAGRELYTYFVSPIAYVVTFAFLAIMGFLFAIIVLSPQAEASMRNTFGNMGVVLQLLSPVLTMRLLAEEARTGTIELLMTSPVRDWEIVIGKFLGGLAFLTVMLALTGWYPLLLFRLGNPDPGPIIAGYVGIYLLASAMFAVGLLTSSWTENQIVAAVLGFGLLLILYLINAAASLIGPPLSGLLNYLGMADHLNDFLQGVIDSRNVLYYLSVVVAALFLTVRSLETRRYR
jgi:ABC-2 type transport system permease protein